MRNRINVRELFNNNIKSIKHFLNWCKESKELCEYDYENLCIALELGAIDKTIELVHFHTGNILDYLEENGYYIEIKPVIKEGYKYLSGVYHKSGYSFFITSLSKRDEAIIKGIQKAIEDLETKL